MTTQAIKRWLSRIFAWWPWRKLPETGYAQTASSSKGSLQEPGWRATVEGTLPQPGITSVAVDHKNDESMLEGSRPALEDPQEMPKASHQSSAGENPNTTHVSSQSIDQAQRDATAPAPTTEQRLAFMRYLAQRGLLNEGFAEGQTPDQYKKKR